MHEAQCLKLNRRCEKCNKVVLKSDYEQHIFDEHTDKPVVVQPQVQPIFSQPSLKQPATQTYKENENVDMEDEEAANQKLIAQMIEEEANAMAAGELAGFDQN